MLYIILIQESENPIRICCVLVPTEAKLGSYTTNPFQFDRKWTVEEAAFSGESYASQNENSILRDELSDLKRLIAELTQTVVLRNTEPVNIATSASCEPSTSKKGRPRKVKEKGPIAAEQYSTRRNTVFGNLFSSVVTGDPDYEPEDEEEEEASISSARSAYSRQAPTAPALPPPIRATTSVRYVTSLQLEING